MPLSFEELSTTYSTVDPRVLVGRAIAEAAKSISDIVALYADVGSRFKFDEFKLNGGRCLQCGIAEQNMIGMAAGMAHEGFKPIIFSYAPFVTGRIFDQIKNDIGEMGLPIGIVGAGAGLSKGESGPLHMCLDDIAMLRTVPYLQIISPADGVEVYKSIKAALESQKPFYIRITGGHTLQSVYSEDYDFIIGKATILRKGRRILVISSGSIISEVLAATDKLANEGKSISVINMHTIKPLDTDILDRYLDFDAYVTVEEHSTCGGLGGAVAEFISSRANAPILYQLGAKDKYLAADLYENLLDKSGLSRLKIYSFLNSLWESSGCK